MNYEKIIPKLSFLYDGKSVYDYETTVTETATENGFIRVTRVENLCVTTTVRYFDAFDAVEWVNRFENTGDVQTKTISELYDCDVAVPFPHQAPYVHSAYIPDPATRTWVLSGPGSCCGEQDFTTRPHCLDVGGCLNFNASGGRSSECTAPFFHATYDGEGLIAAVGWTGQWRASVTREENTIGFRSGVERVALCLDPGECVRTSSVVLMRYAGDRMDGQNKWRRLVKQHFSLIGTGGRPKYAPFCLTFWGGMPTHAMLERLALAKKEKLPYEYLWVDAGWYGTSTQESPDEFVGDWGSYTGNWCVNTCHHPDGFTEVRSALDNMGWKFLLWFEPERVMKWSPIVSEHPEYFLEYPGDASLLLNLGDERAWQYCYEMLSERIETLRIDCYRQDFNIDPLRFWRTYDKEGRVGSTEIKYISGLYRLWDALLARFPHLIIDNCASGGRRIDIETLRRSVPLWRSDFQCAANYRPEGSQVQHISYGAYMPYSGTGTGRACETYRMRSAYAPGLDTQFLYTERHPNPDAEGMAFIRKYGEEYLRIRPYLSSDMYPLTDTSDADTVWSGVQYFDPDTDSGIVQLFRRSTSQYTVATYSMRGLVPTTTYLLRDADTDEIIRATGAEMAAGVTFTIPEKHTAKLYYLTAEV